MTPEEVVASARRCVGARFRAQGRDPLTGLDCVGVAAVAMDKTMPAARYPQRGQDWRSIALVAEAMGLWPIFPGEVRADVPLGDEGERYRLEIMPSAGASRTVESVLPGYDYGPVEQAADGSGGAASVTIPLSQIGVIAPSLPVISRTFTL